MSFPPFQAIPKLVDLSEIPLDVSLILHPCTFAKIHNVRYSDRRMRAAWKSFVTFTSSSFCIMPEMMRWHPVCAQLPLDDSIFDSNRQTLHNGDKIGGVLFSYVDERERCCCVGSSVSSVQVTIVSSTSRGGLWIQSPGFGRLSSIPFAHAH
ncbi:hypothetical protein JG688_00009226 [Phytophthora aleatoria]|uniref:Uncharacterized protein n=1 Tax=Phytophthora aleatoria TaxID=2496075 RepID=A0A8J5IRN8_9STRA|nr:hypothetical protein JG688_00009226 [Phytophthora aleatoria]